MADGSAIEWTEATWNPIRGCSRVSEGCRNCYAERVAARFSGPGQPYEGLAEMKQRTVSTMRERADGSASATLRRVGVPAWTGAVRMVPEQLSQPMRWKRPRRIFVNSMSDLFHESLTNEQIALIFGAMAVAPQHTFQVLTKRARRMREWFEWARDYAPDSGGEGPLRAIWEAICCDGEGDWPPAWENDGPDVGNTWPLPNVWLGVSVEHQNAANERIPDLLATPAAVRWLSCEPLLGPLEFDLSWEERIAWVVAGGESGPHSRPMQLDWARALRDQCVAAGIPFFFKQWGAWVPGSQVDPGTPTHAAGAGPKRVGKKIAGRRLDGRTWDEYPGAGRLEGK